MTQQASTLMPGSLPVPGRTTEVARDLSSGVFRFPPDVLEDGGRRVVGASSLPPRLSLCTVLLSAVLGAASGGAHPLYTEVKQAEQPP